MVSFPTEKEICYSPHSAFYTSTRSLFQVVKQPTREADHSPISCSQFMKECSKTPSATCFLACTVVKLPLLSASKKFQFLFNGIDSIHVWCMCVFVCVCVYMCILLLPLPLQPTVGFDLSSNVLPFFPICHQLSPSSHTQHLKNSFYFLFPSCS